MSNDHNARDVYIELYIRDHACRFSLSFANSWLGLDFFPSKGGKCMGYYSFDLTSLLSPRTSIGFHKRMKITRGGIKDGTNARDSGPNSGTKVCKHQNGI